MTSPADLVLSGTDLSTVAVLLVVLWLDGWRQLPADAVVVRRPLLAPWRVYAPAARIGGIALLSWWPPFVVPLVLRSGEPTTATSTRWSFDVAVARAARRRRRLTLDVGVVRLIGIVLVAWIALAIPMLTAYAGAHGLLRGIITAFLISATIASITANALRSACLSWREAARRALPLLSPFGAGRAPEVVLDAAFAGVSPIVTVRVLLGERAFLVWLRPMAFDALAESREVGRRESVRSPESRLADVPTALLHRAVAPPTNGALGEQGATEDERYCARCGHTFRAVATTCADCGDLPLRDLP